jgi:hypothetical protein
MAKIICPNKKYNGVSASVNFTNGVGETDDRHLIKWFKSHGYKVENNEKIEPSIEIDKMTADELIKFAKNNEIDIGKATSKDGILKKIEESKEE